MIKLLARRLLQTVPQQSCFPGSGISAALGTQSKKRVIKQQSHIPIPFPVLILTLPHGEAQWEQSPFNFGFI